MSFARRRPRNLALSLAIAIFASLLLAVAPSPEATAAPGAQAEAPWWVEWLAAFDKDGDKIDDEAEAVAAEALAAGKLDATVPVLVTFTDYPADTDAFLAKLGAAKDAFLFETQPVMDLNVPASKLALLGTLPGIAAVEHDRILSSSLDVSSPATQANRGTGANTFYNGKTAQDLGYTGEDMVVAVLDTGVQDAHNAFAGKWIAGANVSGSGTVGNCLNPVDDDGHGSHVASTVLGKMPADNLYGTAMDAKLVEVKVSVGPASVGGTDRGFEFVKKYNDALASGQPMCGPNDDHIDVATLSFGSTGRGGPNAGTSEMFIDALVKSGVAVTIAAGNCGPSPSSTCSFGDDDNGISSPANAAGSISVANSNDRNTVDRGDDTIAPSSSRGPNNGGGDTAAGGATNASNLKDRYRKPEIAAPGTSIKAAGPAPFTLSTKSGTSMATPHVAGIAALLLEAGEDVKDQTGGVNLMASTGNGYVNDSYVEGQYPVRDAIIHAADYKEEGAKALWTGPNSAGLKWNNAWGYGHVNAFDALCWAWDNVLAPGGATRPDAVATTCPATEPPPSPSPSPTTEPSPDPTPTSDPTSSPSPSPSEPPTDGGTTYYFHSLTGNNTIDQNYVDGATFDKNFPTFGEDEFSIAQDIPGLQNAGLLEMVDPTWDGELDSRATSLSVDFWAEEIPDQDLGSVHYTVRVKPQGSTSYVELLPAIEADVSEIGPLNIKHTFTQMGTAAAPQPLDLPAGPLKFTIRGTYTVDDAYTRIYFDSTNYPSGFSINGGGSGPDPSPSPSPTTSPSPEPTPTEPPPTGGRGTYPVDTNDRFGDLQWNMDIIKAPQAWQERRATGHGITIAVTDSGLDLSHPDFSCPGKITLVPGADVTDGDDDPNPVDVGLDEHGTHVAGIAGACTNNNTGVIGVAPDATIMPIRTIGSGGGFIAGLTTKLDQDMADSVRLATDNGAHVINMSIGPIPPLSHMGDAVYPKTEEALAYARDNGVVIAAAAGNFSQPTCEYPSRSRNVICVVATDRNDQRSDYSDLGINIDPNGDPELQPVVAAPGGSGYTGIVLAGCEDDILSTTWTGGDHGFCSPANGYDYMSGTSMASPHVAGVAALLYDRLGGVRTKENADLIVDTILQTSEDLYTPGWDPLVGWGRVDALAAVQAIEPVGITTNLAVTETSATSGQYTDQATVEAALTDEQGAALADFPVTFELAGAGDPLTGDAVTDANGVARHTFDLDAKPGDYTLTISYAGNDEYEPSIAEAPFALETEETVTSLSINRGQQPRVLTATLTDADDPASGFADRTIEFLADGEVIGTAVTDTTGTAALEAPAPYDSGRYVFLARFAGDDYLAASESAPADPTDQRTNLAFTAASADSGQYTDEVRIEAALTDQSGSPMDAQQLSFELNGPGGAREWALTTDAAGTAGQPIELDLMPGDYQLTVRYAGSTGYEASVATSAFTLEKEDAAVALVLYGRGSSKYLISRLSDADDVYGSIAGRLLDFYADGEHLGSATTGTYGQAYLQPPPKYRNGKHNYEATFAGDAYFKAAKGTYST